MRRLLIIGCGDVGLRLARVLRGRWRIYALTHSQNRYSTLRAEGVMPVSGDLDRPETLQRIAGLAQDVVHLAPPPGSGARDTRTINLIRALAKGGSLPQRLVYISTSGVYGDCGGDVIDETRRARPFKRSRKAPARCGTTVARVGRRERRAGQCSSRAGNLFRRSASDCAPQSGHTGPGAGARSLYKPHPRRRSGANRIGGAYPRTRRACL